MKIPVKVPLEAVGKNLGEHPLFVLSGFTVNDSSIFLKMDSSEIEKFTEEFHNGKGVLTKNSEAQCFYSSSKAKPGWPDIWIAIDPQISVDGREIVNFYSFIGRPRSKGILTLDTNKYTAGVRDDQQLALIDYKFLTNPDDVEALLDGIYKELTIFDCFSDNNY